jgi:8-oxo-dGTP diphosphatase
VPPTEAAANAAPTSIKGVVLDRGHVLLLVNERGEWDLPGGRPDPGEDHGATLMREVREETGLDVRVGARLDEHLFEVLPQRFVRIVAYLCTLEGTMPVAVSHEHQEIRWVPVADLAETFGGYRLPSGYLGAIRQAICQPLSPSAREV